MLDLVWIWCNFSLFFFFLDFPLAADYPVYFLWFEVVYFLLSVAFCCNKLVHVLDTVEIHHTVLNC